MLKVHHPIPQLAAMLAVLTSIPAFAQTYRPHGDSVPPRSHAPLVIVQDDQGYSISARPDHKPAIPMIFAETAIGIGAGLKVDRSLFAAPAGLVMEASHAPRR